MIAVRCTDYGPPEELELLEVDDPRPGPGQVVVRIHAAAVNYPDVLAIAGRYQVREPVPFTPGSEFAGEVVAVGAEATLRPGDRVFGTVPTGAFAEQVVVDQVAVSAVPDKVSFADAAAFGVTYRTAYHALRSVAEVDTDDWVVVLGAAGGVGLAAVDLAKTMGARVVAASSGAKLAVCRERGADAAIDYDNEDLKSRIRELTGGGAHVVLDPVGGPYAEPALRALRRNGVFVTLGYAAGSIPAIPLNLVLLKAIAVRGMELRTFAMDHPEQSTRDVAELQRLFAEGRIRPHIGARFPLSRTAEALRLVADRGAVGKVVIEVA
ncbi:MAG: NADPH:quinone oxidoreductase family protein [Mycolicibacterium hassiacum]|uniref:NADPH:quinone oxidoreductase family protein n=1 Tax=Mycolicibacterium hassiacum TaxID=46351 RepID=UPI0023F7812B|nr:NADPH:quinone oxidoreductase family protein [Mycolicibacterium hassiacum]MBX5488869.1 NADPH:quinone oxidoreductase family protein [Mycolicibacterium hassiacum]